MHFRAPCEGAVPQRVGIPPGNCPLQPVAVGAGEGGNDDV